MSIFNPLRAKLASKPSPQRPFSEDDERRLRRMTSSKAWTNYLDLIDAEVNILSERLIQATPEETPFLVAEIRGLRSVPEKLNLILRRIDHERSAATKRAESRQSEGGLDGASFFASPFWRSDSNIGTPLQ